MLLSWVAPPSHCLGVWPSAEESRFLTAGVVRNDKGGRRWFGMTKMGEWPGSAVLEIICHSDRREESACLSGSVSPQSAAKSSHVGFEGSINATFFSRRHFLISVSRAMALFTY